MHAPPCTLSACVHNLELMGVEMPDRSGHPGSIDRCVGARIRARRQSMGLTPESFAAGLGCEPDLILRYENGDARAGAAALLMLTRLCRVGVGYFLADLTD